MGLTIRKVERLSKPGRYGDGKGLYLQISRSGGRSWTFRYEVGGKETAMGLGPIYDISLEEARELARQQRALLRQGIDPLAAARKTREENRAAREARQTTFAMAAEAYLGEHAAKWKSPKTSRLITTAFSEYVNPIIGALPVGQVSKHDVVKVLKQEVPAFRAYPAGTLWSARVKTARVVRSNIEAVLDFATAKDWRSGDNAARWKGNLAPLLFEKTKGKRTQDQRHHRAMAYAEVPAFLAELRASFSIRRRALEFCVLTATRTGEVLSAKWSEVDFDNRTWTIPAERMKGSRAHVVPLAGRALELLEKQPRVKGNDHLFPGGGREGRLSERALFVALAEFRDDCSVHGFRSAFRDWCGERTAFPVDVVELCLAHLVGSQTERAYSRSSLLEKRRALMSAWSEFCSTPQQGAEILPLRK